MLPISLSISPSQQAWAWSMWLPAQLLVLPKECPLCLGLWSAEPTQHALGGTPAKTWARSVAPAVSKSPSLLVCLQENQGWCPVIRGCFCHCVQGMGPPDSPGGVIRPSGSIRIRMTLSEEEEARNCSGAGSPCH